MYRINILGQTIALTRQNHVGFFYQYQEHLLHVCYEQEQ